MGIDYCPRAGAFFVSVKKIKQLSFLFSVIGIKKLLPGDKMKSAKQEPEMIFVVILCFLYRSVINANLNVLPVISK